MVANPPNEAAVQHRIRIENSGEAFGCCSETNVLTSMEVLGRKGIPVGCRGGGCGICKVRIVEGPYRTAKMSRSCVSEQEQSEGYALACRLFADGDLQLRVVGKMARAFEGSDSTFRFSAHRFQRAEGNNQEE